MVRSPGSRDPAEAPLTPPDCRTKDTLLPGRGGEYTLNEISFGGHHHSEIPQGEMDYYPSDESHRSLFRKNGCECYECDCDCMSDGVSGCLRRNRRCLFMILILTLTTMVIIIIFNSLNHDQQGRYVPDGDGISRWVPSQDLNNLSNDVTEGFIDSGFSNERIQIPVMEDPRDPDYVVDILPRNEDLSEGHEDVELEIVRWRNKREIAETPDKEYEHSVKDAILDRKSLYEDALAELNELEKIMLNPKKKFEATMHTVFEPFSFVDSTTPLWSKDIRSDKTIITEREGSGSMSTTDTDMPQELTTLSYADQTFIYETSSYYQTTDIEDQDEGVPNIQENLISSSEEEHSGLNNAQVTSTTTEDTPRSFTTSQMSQETLSTKNKFETDRDDEMNDSDIKGRTDGIFILEPYDNVEAAISGPSSPHEVMDGTVGISLSEAKKRKQNDRKNMLLNSRVVSHPSDILLPTAPDDAKFVVNAVETLKTSQQSSLTPSAFAQYFSPYQMCFYANPLVPGKAVAQNSSPRTFSIEAPPFFRLPHVASDPKKETSYHFPTQQNILSFNINNYAAHGQPSSHFPPSAGSLYSFTSPHHFSSIWNGARQPQQPPLFCTNLQPPLIHLPAVTTFSSINYSKCVDCEYGSVEHLPDIDSREAKIISGKDMACLEHTVSCRDGSACVLLENWCDNQVHCKDGSDEIYCSCRERLPLDRLCDGYLDCPNGEDESGCFGCPKSTFSCDTFDEPRACISLSRRCDGIRDCPTGKDEMDCSALFLQVNGSDSHHVSYSKGFLHRNWKGDWYPVCVEIGGNEWSKESCIAELGDLSGQPEVSLAQVSDLYKGPFIVRRGDDNFILQEHCKGHVSTYVNCPEMECGTRIMSTEYAQSRFKRLVESEATGFGEWWRGVKKEIKKEFGVKDVYWKLALGDEDSGETTVNDYRRRRFIGEKSKREEIGRVVGGKESEPRAWPWVVALYKNGGFHCGGVILDERWIMTAAHCVDSYWKHYYEIRSGLLRRFSFSPMEQVRTVSHVIIHERYNKTIMNNDVALLRLRRPLLFNRWVRPICLPSISGQVWGPLPGTKCIAVGWGALSEHGSNPDQMREVEVPILSKCRHVEDVQGHEICAGIAEGGKDTCQGDSGGPLLCRDSKSSWYSAGIVSHGEGCARPGEPGAYTRVSLFIDWITANANEFQLPSTVPMNSCPGFRCTSASRRCISHKWVCNGFTDCLNGEDELDCPRSKSSFRHSGSEAADSSIISGGTILLNDEGVVLFSGQGSKEKRKKSLPKIELPSIVRASAVTSINALAVKPEVTENPKQEASLNYVINYTVSNKSSETFQCHRIIQTVPENHHCDGLADCEDGTDEMFCSCRNFLARKRPELICDGHEDCMDLTDENQCHACASNEYNCRISKQCIPRRKKCDGVEDCTLGEDEEDCTILAKDGIVDVHSAGKPLLSYEGRLMTRKGDEWTSLCHNGNAIKTAHQACAAIGSSGYERFEQGSDSTNSCLTLDLTCSKRLMTNLQYYVSARGEYHWPWHTVVYSDGVELCSAALLESDWLLTSYECIKSISLQRNHIVAKLGAWRRNLPGIVELGTQVIRVDGIRRIGDSKIVLLHLSKNADVTWSVRPLSVSFWFDVSDSSDLCVAAGDETTFLASIPNCGKSFRCYSRMDSEYECQTYGSGRARTGVVVCQSRIGWYPASVYHEENGFCASKYFFLNDVMSRIKDIKEAMGEDMRFQSEVECRGMRCREGLCLPVSKICDGKADCPNGEDENSSSCMKRDSIGEVCNLGELLCTNGACIPKHMFADGKDDCGDGSDEPNPVLCSEYLKLTAPHRICDGVSNCYDKSDERPDMCTCTPSKFSCSSSDSVCVPFDYVCDGEKDCPNGEDEMTCVASKVVSIEENNVEVELIHMTYGIWHTLCSPNITRDQADEVCIELGYKKALGMSERNQTRIIPKLDPYSTVKLNARTNLRLRSDRVFATAEESGHCQVLIVQCV